jgi:hypothetical protein
LFEFDNPLTESADFVGSGKAGVVEDLFAEDFGQPLAERGVLVSESFVVCAEVGEVGQQRPAVHAGCWTGGVRVRLRGRGFARAGPWWRYRSERSTPGTGDGRDGDPVVVGAESVEGVEDFSGVGGCCRCGGR